jgi:hypothetical protein
MNAAQLESQFAAMGARLKVRDVPSRWQQGDLTWVQPKNYAVDIQRDREGQFFELRLPTHLRDALEVSVMQNEPKQRHLLLLVRNTAGQESLDRFLCGHDEREWFVAAVPGGASSVRQAMDALQPTDVRNALARQHVSSKQRYARKNRAFRRQGEWFFVPEPSLQVNEKLVLHNEPLRRGAGKPHWVADVFRTGGEVVYVCAQHPNGLTEKEYRRLLRTKAEAPSWRWRVMRRNMRVYARGTVRHSDHATITLPCWHRVLMNTETQSRAMAQVAFLD